jgi:hypothetical protein
MTTYIYGASDDLVEFEGDFREEFYLKEGDKSYFHLSDPETGDSMYVYAEYSPMGWLLGVVQPPDDEDRAILPWDVSFDSEFSGSRYSITLVIETPEHVVVIEVDSHGSELG